MEQRQKQIPLGNDNKKGQKRILCGNDNKGMQQKGLETPGGEGGASNGKALIV